MSYALYLTAVTAALRDRVLRAVDDTEARNVLEASIRALSGLADALADDRPVPPLADLPAGMTVLAGPPENPAIRAGSAITVTAACERLAASAWPGSAEGRAEARTMIAWERDRMAEAIDAMIARERPSPTALAETGPNPLLIQRDAVEAYFQQRCGPAARVTAFRQAIGGRSRQTALLTLEGTDLPPDLVIQRDHPAGISPQSVADEYPALELIAGSALKSPQPVLLERSRDPLGAPFMVTRQAPGVVAGSDYFDPPKNPALGAQLGAQLALLHAFDAAPLRGSARHTLPPGEGWTDELDRLEQTWQRLAHWPSISATAAFGWMRHHVGAIGDDTAIIHNDAAFHNVLVDDGTITALLDWELVHLGHPAEDLGYCRPFLQEMGAWDAFLDAYVAAGGTAFSPAVIDYFSLRGLLYLMTLFQNGGRRMFESKATDDINLAEVGASFMPKVMLRLANVMAAIMERQNG